MYQYRAIDQQIVQERVEEFRDQVQRRLSGELSEDEFRPLRLMNGLYLQRHAYMLRVAIPYGLLSSEQVRMLGYIARRYDKGYGHITTRQNIQYNWPKLKEVPDLLADLASVQMHAIQTSGNCVRNVTADHLSGIAADELEDPRPYCELLRQFSTFHPEFTYLPRKFKIAISGRTEGDGAATAAHDIGLRLVEGPDGEVGFKVFVGGGLGRTPILAKELRSFLPKRDLCTYTEAILRVYNLHGRRDNKYKARIKILTRALGIEEMRAQVEAEFERMQGGPTALSDAEIERVKAFFTPPEWNVKAPEGEHRCATLAASDARFARWLRHNTVAHKAAGYRAVYVSLKAPDIPPGDVTAVQLEAIADLADRFSFGEVVTTHAQNALLPHVEAGDLYEVWLALEDHGLATANIGTLTDMICCPGLDFCSLANAGSISIAEQLNARFDDLDYLYDLGELQLKMSGCINACGHHHVGHIGILGINKRGEEWYQIMLGGSADDDASLGRWIGPAVPHDAVSETVETLLETYLELRQGDEERFIDTVRRVGLKPFSSRVYGDKGAASSKSSKTAASRARA